MVGWQTTFENVGDVTVTDIMMSDSMNGDVQDFVDKEVEVVAVERAILLFSKK